MKKKISLGIIIAGAAIVSAGLAGCGDNTKKAEVTKDSLIEKAADVFASSKSVDADIDMDIDVNMSGTGLSMEMKYDAHMDVEGCNDGTSHYKGHMNISALGMKEDADIEMYTVKEGDDLVHYYKKTEGGNEDVWSYSKSDNQTLFEAEKPDKSDITEVVQKIQDTFSDMKLHKDTVDFNNVNCYLIEGTVKGEKLYQLITESVPDIDQTYLESHKMMDFDTEFYFKAKDETPYAVVVDMGDIFTQLIAAELDQTEGIDIDISADEMKLSIVFNSFNKVKEITVPDEVKKKAVESSEPLDITDMTGIYGQYGFI